MSDSSVLTATRKALRLDPRAPLKTALLLIKHQYFDPSHSVSTLCSRNGTFYEYEGGIYHEVEDQHIRQTVYQFLGQAVIAQGREKGKPFNPGQYRVSNVIDALRACANMNASQSPPCWLRNQESRPDAKEIIALANGLLHVPTRELLEFTPEFFSFNRLPFKFNPQVSKPVRWLAFLEELFAEDKDAKQTLQEFMGYLLTPETRYQKILMLIGPKRSGKGTIVRVMQHLLGPGNYAGPTLQGLAQPFGLSSLIGKSAAFVSDARIGRKTDTSTVTERLLNISGEDVINVPRKYREDWTGRLTAKFWVVSNELPRIIDPSAALASRFLILEMKNSFYGREDAELADKLVAELPGIFLWALEGLDRLNARGKFIQPRSGNETVQQFEDLSSPISAFLGEECELGAEFGVDCLAAYNRWQEWCAERGNEPGDEASFGKDMRSVIPGLERKQHRVSGKVVGYYPGFRLRNDAPSPDVTSDKGMFNEEMDKGSHIENSELALVTPVTR
jgi:putative DNA primase/helicase